MSESMAIELNTRKPYLQLVADGIKTIDVRVVCPTTQDIQAGQTIVYVAGGNTVRTRVVRVTEYPSFDEMLSHEDPHAIGGSLGGSKSQLLAVIRSIYPPDQERLGVLAIEIQRI